jgi:hypothetical protein
VNAPGWVTLSAARDGSGDQVMHTIAAANFIRESNAAITHEAFQRMTGDFQQASLRVFPI